MVQGNEGRRLDSSRVCSAEWNDAMRSYGSYAQRTAAETNSESGMKLRSGLPQVGWVFNTRGARAV